AAGALAPRGPALAVLPAALPAPRRRPGDRVASGRAGRPVHDAPGSPRPSGGRLSLPASPGALRDQRHVPAPQDHLLLPRGGGVGDRPHGGRPLSRRDSPDRPGDQHPGLPLLDRRAPGFPPPAPRPWPPRPLRRASP